MPKKYLILIVNYKKDILNSETYKSILELDFDDFDLIVWDNLALNCNKEIFNNLTGSGLYIPSKLNASLSSIYNKIISEYLDENKYKYFIILDNDTHITDDFFISHENAESFNSNLYIPQVFNNEQLVSPGYLIGFKGGYLKNYNTGINEVKNITAINSGMIISSKYLKNYNVKYDERIKFYGTDDNFMKSYQLHNKTFFLLDYKIKHDLSKFNKEEAKDIKRWRLNDQIRGLFYNCKSPLEKFLSVFYIIYLYIRFFIKG